MRNFGFLFFGLLALDILGIFLLTKLLHRKDMKPYVIIINVVLTLLWITLVVLVLLLLLVVYILYIDKKDSISQAEDAKLFAQIDQLRKEYGATAASGQESALSAA